MPSKNRNLKADPDLVNELENPPKKLCVVGQLVAEHPNGDSIQAALNNQRWSASQLVTVLRKIGPMSAGAVVSHRKGSCVCE